MSETIDSRVVQLKFDNEEFEKGVKTSLKTLDDLSEKINKLPEDSEKFKDLEDSLKEIDLESINDNVQKLADRFDTLGIVGMSAIHKISDAAMNVATGALGALMDPIKQIFSGGFQRAQNLAQAQFLLAGQGIENWKEEVDGVIISMEHLTEEEKALGQTTDSIFKDIDYGVKDTAYGLDEASKVAAQLSASGVEIGDNMRAALRGISGVAAMTGASYSEIGEIYAAIAGQGRAMSGEFRRISLRGLNAKAAVARYLEEVQGLASATEDSVSEMAKAGEIDFQTFANAMDYAFGEHAKDANKTFVGALANTQAALSRIGEMFWTPVMESARQILVSVIPVINNLKNILKPFFTFVTSGIGMIADAISGLLRLIGFITKPIGNILSSITDGVTGAVSSIKGALGGIFSGKTIKQSSVVSKGVDKVGNALLNLVGDSSKAGKAVKGILEKHGVLAEEESENVNKVASSIGNLSGSIDELGASSGKAGRAAKKASSGASKASGKAAKTVKESTEELSDVIDNLHKVTGIEKDALKDLVKTANEKGWESQEVLNKANELTKGNAELSKRILDNLKAGSKSSTDALAKSIDSAAKLAIYGKESIEDLVKTAKESGWESKEVLEKVNKITNGNAEMAKKISQHLQAAQLVEESKKLNNAAGDTVSGSVEAIDWVIGNLNKATGIEKAALIDLVKTANEKGWESQEVLEKANKLAKNDANISKVLLDNLKAGSAIKTASLDETVKNVASITGKDLVSLDSTIDNVVKITGAEKSSIEDLANTIKKSGANSKETLEKANTITKGNAELSKKVISHLQAAEIDPKLSGKTTEAAADKVEGSVEAIDFVVDNLSKTTKIEKKALYDLVDTATKNGWSSKEALDKANELAKGDAEVAKLLLDNLKKGSETKTATLEETIKNVAIVAGKDEEAVKKVIELANEKGWDSAEVLNEAKLLANNNEDLAKQMMMHLQAAQAYSGNIVEEAEDLSSAGGGGISAAGGAAVDAIEDIEDATENTKDAIEKAYDSIIKTEEDVYDKYSELTGQSIDDLEGLLEARKDAKEWEEFLKDEAVLGGDKKAKEKLDKQLAQMQEEIDSIDKLNETAEKLNSMSEAEEKNYKDRLHMTYEDAQQVMFIRAKMSSDMVDDMETITENLHRATGIDKEVLKNIASIGKEKGYDSEEYLNSISDATKNLTKNTEELNDIITDSLAIANANPFEKLRINFERMTDSLSGGLGAFGEGLSNIKEAIVVSITEPFNKAVETIANSSEGEVFTFVDAITNKLKESTGYINGISKSFTEFTKDLIPTEDEIADKSNTLVNIAEIVFSYINDIGSSLSTLFKNISNSDFFAKAKDILGILAMGSAGTIVTVIGLIETGLLKILDILSNISDYKDKLKNTEIFKTIKTELDKVKKGFESNLKTISEIPQIKTALNKAKTSWNMFEWSVESGNVDWWIGLKLKNIKYNISKFIEWLKNTEILRFLNEGWEYIKAKFSFIENDIKAFKDKISEYMKPYTNGKGAPGFIEYLINKFDELKTKVKNFKFPSFQEFVDNLNNTIKNSWFWGEDNVFKRASNFFSKDDTSNEISKKFSSWGEALAQGTTTADKLKILFSLIKDSVSDFIEWAKVQLKDVDWEKILNTTRAIAVIAVLFAIAKSLYDLGEMFKRVGMSLRSGIGAVKNKIVGVKTGSDLQELGNAILKIGAIFLAISLLSWDQIKKGIAGFATVVGSFLIMYKVLHQIQSMGKGLDSVSIASSLLAINGALFILGKTIMMFANMKWTDFIDGTFKMIESFGVLMGALAAVSVIVGGPAEKKFVGVAGVILAIAGGLYILKYAIEMYADLDILTMAKGLAKITVVLVVMITALLGLSTIIDTINKDLNAAHVGKVPEKLNGIAGQVLAMVGALYLFAGVIKIYSAMDIKDFIKGTLLAAAVLTLLTTSLSTISIAATHGNKENNVKGMAALVIAIAGSLLLLMPTLQMFAGMNILEIIKSVGAISALFIALTYAIKQMLGIGLKPDETAAHASLLNIIGIAIILGGITTLFWLLSQWDSNSLLKASIAVTIIELGLAAIMKSFESILKDKIPKDTRTQLVSNFVNIAMVLAATSLALVIIKGLQLDQNSEGLVNAAIAMSVIMIAIGASVAIITRFSKYEINKEQLDGMAGLIMGFGVAAFIIAGGFALATRLGGEFSSPETYIYLATAISEVLLAISGCVIAIKKFTSTDVGSVNLKGFGSIMTMLVLAAFAIGVTIGVAGHLLGDNADKAIEIATAITEVIGVMSLITTGIIELFGRAGALSGITWSSIGEGMTMFAVVLYGAIAIFAGAFAEIGFLYHEGKDNVFKWFFELLEDIGTHVGNFVSNLVTGGLDSAGKRISKFWTDIEPFTKGLKTIKKTDVDNAVTLTKIFVALTATEFVDALTFFLSPGYGLFKIAEENIFGGKFQRSMKQMAEGLKAFATATEGIGDTARLSVNIENLRKLAEISANLPETSAFRKLLDFSTHFITYENKYLDFGIGMNIMAKSLKVFTEQFVMEDGITPALSDIAVEKAENAIELLKKIAAIKVPEQSALTTINKVVDFVIGLTTKNIFAIAEATKGRTKFDEFSDGMIAMARGLKKFVEGVKDADIPAASWKFGPTKVETAISYLEKISKIDIPETSLLTMVTGFATGGKFADFAKGIENLGTGLVNFIKSISVTDKEIENSLSGNSLSSNGLDKASKSINDWYSHPLINSGNEWVINKFVDLAKKLGEIKFDQVTIDALTGTVLPDAEKSGMYLSDLGMGIAALGSGLVGFCQAVNEAFKSGEIDIEAIRKAVSGLNELAKMKDPPTTVNIDKWFGGKVLTSETRVDYEDYGKKLGEIGKGLVAFQEAIKGKEFDTENIKSAVEIINVLSNVATNGTGGDITNSISDNLIAFGRGLVNFATDFGTFVTDITTITNGDDFNVFNSNLDICIANIRTLLSLFKGPTAAVDSATLTSISTGLAGIAENLERIANQSLNKFIAAFSGGIESLSQKYDSFYKTGVTSGLKLLRGFYDQVYIGTEEFKSFPAIISDLATNIIYWFKGEGEMSVEKQFEEIGKNLIKGLVKGIQDKDENDKLNKALEDLGKNVEETLKKSTEEESPSKMTQRIGAYLGEGLVMGINSMGAAVSSSAYNLGETGIDAVSKAIADIANDDFSSLSMDLAPVIAPTLDLSSVNASASQMSSIFKDQQIAIQNAKIEADMKLTNQLADAFDQIDRPNVTNNVTVDGAENPDLWAQSFVNTMRREMRMANG